MSLDARMVAAHGLNGPTGMSFDDQSIRAKHMAGAGLLESHDWSIRRSSSNSCNGSTTSDADSLPAAAQGVVPPLFSTGHFMQPGIGYLDDMVDTHSAPHVNHQGPGTAPCSTSTSHGIMTVVSRAGSSLCSTLSGVSEVGTLGTSDASLPPSGRPSPRQVLPQPPAVCKPPLALPAPSGKGAMLVDAASGRLEWVQPSGPRKAGEGTEPEQQGIISFSMLPQGGALMSITLLASGFVIGPSGCSVRELACMTGADIKSWSDSFAPAGGCAPRPARTFLLQGPPASVLAAVEVAAAAVLRYKYLCEGACFGQQVSRTQVVRGITFVYLPPPRRKVPYAAAIASAPLPRAAPPYYAPVSTPNRPQTQLSAAAPAWPASLHQPTLQQAVQHQPHLALHQAMQMQHPRQQQLHQQALLHHHHRQQQPAVPPLQLQPLPGDSIWSSCAVGGTTGWPTAADTV